MKSEAIDKLGAAFSKAQAALKPAVKDSTNPFFKSSYADLTSIWEACRKALTDNGLSVIQTPNVEMNPDGTKQFVLVTTLLHSSGQFISGSYPIKPTKDDPQGNGSAISYARRYALASMTGVCSADDDGEGAQGRSHENAVKTAQTPVRTAQDSPRTAQDSPRTAQDSPRPAIPEVKPSQAAPAKDAVTDAQRKKFWAEVKKTDIPEADLRIIVKEVTGVESTASMTEAHMDIIIRRAKGYMEATKKLATQGKK
jgi:hypothetical protein